MRTLVVLLLCLVTCGMNLPAPSWALAERDVQVAGAQLSERSQPAICPHSRAAEVFPWSIQPSLTFVALAIDGSWHSAAGPAPISHLQTAFGAGTLQSLDVRLQV